MVKETFRYIEQSDEKHFVTQKEGKIELRQFTEDLIFATNFDSSFDAIYCIGAKEPKSIVGSPQIGDFDVFGFGQHGELRGTVVYEEESFRSLENEGSIKFWLKSNFNNAVGEQSFKKSSPVIPITEVTEYGVTIYDDVTPHDIKISLSAGSDIIDIYNKLAVALTGKGLTAFKTTENKLRVTSTSYGNEIYMVDLIETESLIDLLGGVDKPMILNGPSEDISFLNLIGDLSENHNNIILKHKKDSHIQLLMYNFEGELIVDEDLGYWSNDPQRYYSFELNWNEQTGSLFIGGELNKIFMTGVERKDCKTSLFLYGEETNHHHIDGLAIYDKVQHTKNYELETSPLTPYDSENPYIDIHYGQGFKENEIKDIIVDGSDSLHFTVKIGVTWYYFFNGSWRTGDGSYIRSTELELFEAKFSELFFNENYDLIIRVFFHSGGWDKVSLDDISILREVGSESAAYITGSVRVSDPIDMTDNSFVDVTTNIGTLEVDLASAAVDISAVTLEEIKQAIIDAGVPGVQSVSDDGNQRLVLVASTTGSTSYISIDDAVDGSILDLVWGNETQDLGEDDETTVGVYADYSELFRWIRSRLGAPLVPVELTDEQLEDCLSEVVYHYNKWRNFKENIVYASLSGNPRNGWEIPASVGGESNITEIILEPRYPSAYYSGRDDLMGNIYIQQMFNNKNIMATAADHHIALVANRDLNLIMNTEVRWEILNRRLFITPVPSDSLKAVIKYKSALTLDEIVTSQSIRDLLLALSKITLGGIRSTFGNSIPGGDGMLQLNGSEMKSEGTADRDRIIDGWKKSTSVYEFIIG
jgi:hypothetical protein